MLGHIVIKVKSLYQTSLLDRRRSLWAESDGASKTRHRACHLLASLKQDAFDELRKDRSDRDLHVPLLSGYPGVHGHVLHRELNLDG